LFYNLGKSESALLFQSTVSQQNWSWTRRKKKKDKRKMMHSPLQTPPPRKSKAAKKISALLTWGLSPS